MPGCPVPLASVHCYVDLLIGNLLTAALARERSVRVHEGDPSKNGNAPLAVSELVEEHTSLADGIRVGGPGGGQLRALATNLDPTHCT